MCLQKRELSLIIIQSLYIVLQVCVIVEGLYQLEVTVFNYNNPTGRCRGCLYDDTRGCCDYHRTTSCSSDLLCDSFFVYCLRDKGRTGRGCSYSGTRTSNFNTNDGPLNFSQSRVLDLENPIILQGLTNTYMHTQGVQLYIEIIDFDPNNADDLIDVLLIDHDLPIGHSSARQNHDGIYDYVMMDLLITARCVRNFQGPDCSQCLSDFAGIMCNVPINECNCSGHGQCFGGVPSLTCDCDPGFTGVECEVNIDDCAGVNCSENGECLDGIRSYTCDCDSGFTGMKCETNIDDCVGVDCSGNGQCVDEINSFSCNCNASFTGLLCDINTSDSEDERLSATFIGGILGAILSFVLLLALLIVLVIYIVLYKKCKVCYQAKKEHSSVSSGQSSAVNTAATHHGRPAVSVRYTKPPSHQRQDSEEEIAREFDNPIYGDENDEVKGRARGNEHMDQSRLLSMSLPDHEFDNPIYATEETENDYSMITDVSTHDDATNRQLQATDESIHNGQLPSSYRPLVNSTFGQ